MTLRHGEHGMDEAAEATRLPLCSNWTSTETYIQYISQHSCHHRDLVTQGTQPHVLGFHAATVQWAWLHSITTHE